MAVVLFDKQNRVLLAERAIEPWKGKYDMPGGFVDLGETIEEATQREMYEELGLAPEDYSELVFVASDPQEYAFSKEVKPVLSFTFAARLLTDRELHAKDDVASIKHANLSEVEGMPIDEFSLPIWPDHIKRAYKLIFKDR